MAFPSVLLIAASDPTGETGIEADQKVLAAHGCYAVTATTALTAPNPTGAADVLCTPPVFLQKQIKACLQSADTNVVKIGLLASEETVHAVAECLVQHNPPQVVLDLLMVDGHSGAGGSTKNLLSVLQGRILPLSTLLTISVADAEMLLKGDGKKFPEIENMDHLHDMAKSLHALGPQAVLLTGASLPAISNPDLVEVKEKCKRFIDVLYDGKAFIVRDSTYQKHQTSSTAICYLATAIAANLAKGEPLEAAVKAASSYHKAAILLSPETGQGNGPMNYFHSVQYLPFSAGNFMGYLLDRDDVKSAWRRYTHHKFIQGLADTTLPLQSFKHFLVQDYIYLMHLARSYALAASKATDLDSSAASAQIVMQIKQESRMHLDYCKGFGLNKTDIENAKESLACIAYSRFILDIGHTEDWIALQVALSPCLFGYSEIAMRLSEDKSTIREGNKYWEWIENYTGDDYQQTIKIGSELLECHAVRQSPTRIEQLVKIFIGATEMEMAFWDSALQYKPEESEATNV